MASTENAVGTPEASSSPEMAAEAVPQTPAHEMMGTAAGDLRELTRFKIKFRWCPAGIFQMGSPEAEMGRDDDEALVEVALTNGYWIAETELTQQQWSEVMESSPWNDRAGMKADPQLPAIGITWEDATEFCQRLTEIAHERGDYPADGEFRLPTEAQWEYACRAGTSSRYSFGDDLDEQSAAEYAEYKSATDRRSRRIPEPVGQVKANPWGIFDMHGNVAEWCRDNYRTALPEGEDPVFEDEGSERVLRGGDFSSEHHGIRSAAREMKTQRARSAQIGFRPVYVFANPQSAELAMAPESSPVPEMPDGLAGTQAGEVRTFTAFQIPCVWCPPGSTTIGSPSTEPGRDADETQVEVVLGPGFWMSSTEVTQEVFRNVTNTQPWLDYGVPTDPQAPAVHISWEAANQFCKSLTMFARSADQIPESIEVRLPTEAEWEYCCRAGTQTEFNYGHDPRLRNVHRYAATRAGVFGPVSHVIQVGNREPNAWGLYDMHGNVSEWCSNWYSKGLSGGTNPRGPAEGSERVLRGGSWQDEASLLRSASRNPLNPEEASRKTGFRFVLAAD